MSYLGIVKFFNRKSKFGFIIENETKKEYYFHAKNIKDEEITDGDHVSFELEEKKRGSACIRINKVTS